MFKKKNCLTSPVKQPGHPSSIFAFFFFQHFYEKHCQAAVVQWVLGMDAYVCVYIYISRSHWIVLCHHPFFFLLFYDLTCSAEALSTAGLSYWVLSSSERNSASPCLHGFLLLSLKRITNIFFPLHDTYNTYVVLTGLFLLCIFKDSYSKAWGKKKIHYICADFNTFE